VDGRATADVKVLAADGTELLSQTLTVKPADGAFAVRVPERGAVTPGEYAVQVQLRPDANDSVVLTDTARVVMTVPRGSSSARPGVAPRALDRPAPSADGRFAPRAANGFASSSRPPCRAPPRLDCWIAPDSRCRYRCRSARGRTIPGSSAGLSPTRCCRRSRPVSTRSRSRWER
jgi:hypothetical protein